MTADDFDARMDALLTMPEGWFVEYLECGFGGWACTVARHDNECAVAGFATAREAIDAAKQMASERDTK